MPDISGASWRFAGSSPLPRLVSKTASGSLLFPGSVSGAMWPVASSWLGRAIAITGAMDSSTSLTAHALFEGLHHQYVRV
jgi:hypothetical protein